MESNFNTYQLKGGKKPASWQLPLTGVLIAKIENGEKILKSIKYVPGENSFYAEDIKGDVEPRQIWFNRGSIRVPKIDKITNALLQAHPWFEKYYELYDPQVASRNKLAEMRAKDQARKLIDESDVEQIKAITLALFGSRSFKWDDDTCELKLREFAEKDPERLQKELNSKDYESKYIAGLAISKGIMKENIGKNAVVWADTDEGLVIKIAKGENGVTKLGEYLATRTEESELVLQEIAIRAKKQDTKVSDESLAIKLSEKDQALAEKEAEITKLKEQLKANLNVDALKEAREKYEKLFKKKISPRYINDITWIENAISAKENED